VWFMWGDIDAAKTLGIRLKSGRLLNSEFASDGINSDSLQNIGFDKFEKDFTLQSSLITATTARMLRVDKLDQQFKNTGTTPVGIVEDFHNESLRDPLLPTFITAERSPKYGGMLVRVKPGMEKQVMASVHRLWRQFFPSKLLDINWVDDVLNKQYEAERKLQQLFMFFSALTMALAALGVFGLIVHAAAQRTKEIGIRKVMGAGVATIAVLLSKDFLKLVFLAIIIASPLAGWVMNKWLQDFAYRISISLWMFVLAAFVAITITVITVSFRAVRAALANPVDSLRAE
jgi:putative ABC transport system permease protein